MTVKCTHAYVAVLMITIYSRANLDGCQLQVYCRVCGLTETDSHKHRLLQTPATSHVVATVLNLFAENFDVVGNKCINDLFGPPESSYIHLKCKIDIEKLKVLEQESRSLHQRLVDTLERAYPAELQRKEPVSILGKHKQSTENATARKEMRIMTPVPARRRLKLPLVAP